MADWRFGLVNSDDDSAIGALGAATSKKVTWVLDDSASASFNMDGTHPQAALIEEITTDLVVYDPGGVKRFRGRMGASTDDVSTAGHACTFSAVDYRGFLNSARILWPGNTDLFTSVDQALIAWTLIADSQALPGGDLGITRGLGQTTGVLRDRTYDEGSQLGDLLTQLGDVDDGYDWEIDANLAFNIFYPQRGNSGGGQYLDYGGRVLSFKRAIDPSTFGNAIRESGDDSLTPVTAVGSFGAAGRWERQIGDTSILDQPTLTERATADLATSETINPSYTVVLKPGWWSPDVLWLGDTVTFLAKSGRLNINAEYRITQVEVDVGDDGGETVTLTIGPVIFDEAQELASALQRLGSLERR